MELPGSDSDEQTARTGSGLLCGIEDETREGEGWEFVEYREVPEAEAEGSSESQFQAPTVQSTGGSEKRADSNLGCGDLPREGSFVPETMDDGEGMVPDHNVDEQQQGRTPSALGRLSVAHLTLVARASWRNAWANIYRSHKRNIFLQTKLEQQDAMLVQTMSRLFLLQRNSFKVPTIPFRVYERHVMHSAALRAF